MRHMKTSHWARYRVPHVEIGSVAAPYRVYVDLNAFFERALAQARAGGRRRPMFVVHGRALDPNDLRRRFGGEGVSFLEPSPDVPPDIGHEEWGYRVMSEFWRRESDVDAVIVSEDSVAKGIAQAALACGVDVPGRVMVVALTNRGLNVFFPVPIVRLEAYLEAMVVAAGDLLLRLIVAPDLPPETLLLPPELAHSVLEDAKT
jgi:DNA-binding LacI/PurR family transcriptional regulator